MNKLIKKFAVLFVLSCGFSLSAAEGTVTFVKGKVEVQRNETWVALNVGDKVFESEIVSTGFQSEARIKVMDSVMFLGPVTRISLKELSSSPEKDKVNVYLNTGSVRTKVNHADNKRVVYQVKTPVGVASVRGTDFSVDDSNVITVFEGSVAVASNVALASVSQNANTGSSAEDEFENSDEIPQSGVLVKANQSVTVTESNSVTVPVANVSSAISNVVSKVSTMSEKEGVSSVGQNGIGQNVSIKVPAVVSEPVQIKTGSVSVEISIE